MGVIFWLTTKEDPVELERRAKGVRPLSAWLELDALKNVQVWRFSLYYFFAFGAFVALSLWLPRYLIGVYKLDIETAGMLGAAYSIPASLFRIYGGVLSDRYGARRVMYWMFSVSVLITFILAYPPTDYVVQSINGPIHFHMSTGLVTFEPKANLPYHTHPVSESITVLSGATVVGVEGREYSLGPLDTIVIPRGTAHSAWNVSSSERGVVHVALASHNPGRDLVPAPAERKSMPTESSGLPEKERVTRFKTASRSEAGPGTSFIDHFNKDLMPGIEMSGGYGAFQPGGRLPAHFHDFDESICIIEGTATCVVEGRRYQQSNRSTALEPRGRVHYFVNETQKPMEMIWVYAGPAPERVIVDESCATVEGNPWKDEIRK